MDESSTQKVPEKDIKDIHLKSNVPMRDPVAFDSPPAKKVKCENDTSVQQEGSKVMALPLGPISYDRALCDLIHLVKPHIRQLVEKSSQEIQSRPTKTPVSILQEFLVQRDITPKYELVHIDGAVEPPFHFRVTVNDFEATGKGHSKKEAKQAAAKALLDIMIENIPNDPKAANENNATTGDNSSQVVSPKDDKVTGNPVGWLQELCMSRRWPPPTYETKEEGGLPHRRMFTISCQVNKLTEIGTGQSKKLAKRQAAHKVWQALQDTPSESTNLSLNKDEPNFPNLMKVTICGAAGKIGQPLSLLLKQAPIFDELALYDIKKMVGLALELNHIDTKCKVKTYHGESELEGALLDSKLVVFVAKKSNNFEENAYLLCQIMEKYSDICPKAVLAIATNPVNSLVPVAIQYLMKFGTCDPKKVIGITSPDVVRAITYVSEKANEKPENVIVPVIGGHSIDTVVPLFSQATPKLQLSEDQQIELTNAVRAACGKEMEESESHLADVYSISKFVVSIGKSLMGTETSDYAYVRTENNLGVDYFVSNIVLGVCGVQRNLGFPKLSCLEMDFLENAIPHIQADINVGNKFMGVIDENEQPEISCMNMSG